MSGKRAGNPRRQCKTCPWRVENDPMDIPNGPKEAAVDLLSGWSTGLQLAPSRMGGMGCHQSKMDETDLPCVGWLAWELGPGNNIGLRVRVMRDPRLCNWELVGEQRTLDELVEDLTK